MSELFERIKDEMKDYDVILVGIGEEFDNYREDSDISVRNAYESLLSILEGKNYYILSTAGEEILDINEKANEKIVVTSTLSEDDKRWDMYLKWLSCTLNRKLYVLELGVLLDNPNVIRWPFERTVMINNNAKLVRINSKLPQLPEQLANKGESFKENPVSIWVR